MTVEWPSIKHITSRTLCPIYTLSIVSPLSFWHMANGLLIKHVQKYFVHILIKFGNNQIESFQLREQTVLNWHYFDNNRAIMPQQIR